MVYIEILKEMTEAETDNDIRTLCENDKVIDKWLKDDTMDVLRYVYIRKTARIENKSYNKWNSSKSYRRIGNKHKLIKHYDNYGKAYRLKSAYTGEYGGRVYKIHTDLVKSRFFKGKREMLFDNLNDFYKFALKFFMFRKSGVLGRDNKKDETGSYYKDYSLLNVVREVERNYKKGYYIEVYY